MANIHVDGKRFLDDKGREVIFNGVNLVHKGEELPDGTHGNYIPEWSEKMFDDLKRFGFNLVRFGLIWAAVEPEMGKYDDNYLAAMGKYIDMCAERGIYVFLDMHQDLYASKYGDGAPDWAVIDDGKRHVHNRFIWAAGYMFDDAIQHASDHFWNNTRVGGIGLQDSFAKMWQHVVKFFADKKNIIGYDIYNEPTPGTANKKIFAKLICSVVKTVVGPEVKVGKMLCNIVKQRKIVEPALDALDSKTAFRKMSSGGDVDNSKFTLDKYYPFLKKVAAAIREIDKNGIIIYENSYWSNVSMPCPVPKIVYNDGTEETQMVFGPHGYDVTVDSVYTNTAGCNRVEEIFDMRAARQQQMNVPVIVGEWGGMVDGSDEYPALETLIDYFDSHKWSQTYWAYWEGQEKTKFMKEIICRPYPRAVSGEIIDYGMNREDNSFALDYICDKARGESVVFCPGKPKSISFNGKSTESFDGENTIIKLKNIVGLNKLEIVL